MAFEPLKAPGVEAGIDEPLDRALHPLPTHLPVRLLVEEVQRQSPLAAVQRGATQEMA